MKRDLNPATIAAHAGANTPLPVSPRPAVAPIYQTSVFSFEDLDQVDAIQEGGEGFIYSRYGNPNHRGFELTVAELEGAENAACMASGMGAISATLMSVMSAGDRVLAADELYGGTLSLLVNDMVRWGMQSTFVDPTDIEAVSRSFDPSVKILYVETISNPTLKVADLATLARIAHENNALFVVDNTFASPYLVQPLKLGADLVIHSATKYLSGHSSVTGGVVAGSNALIGRIRKTAISLGATFSPFDTWLATMGMKTLALRMERASSNALALATFLESHPKIQRVLYPGLSSHPQHELAKRMMPLGFGGMVSVELKGGLAEASAMLESMRLCHIVPSLAGISTTTSHPAKTSHRSMPPERRTALGISESLVRVSTGVEHAGDIIADFAQALARA